MTSKFLSIIFTLLIITSYTSSRASFGELQNNSTQPIVSNSVGIFQLDKQEYDVSYTKGDSVKAYGIVNKPQDGGKITITYTLPDKSLIGIQIFTNKTSEYFDSHYPLDSNSQKGEYRVLATYNHDVIGTLYFTVKQVPVKQTPVTNSTIIPHKQTIIIQNTTKPTNQTSASILDNSTSQISKTKIINYIDTQLSLDSRESVNKGYVNVHTRLNTNSELALSSNTISILVDGQYKTYVSTNTWSSDIWIGFGSHTVEAVYPQTNDPKDNSIIYRESNTIKTIFVQEPTDNIPQTNVHNPTIASTPSPQDLPVENTSSVNSSDIPTPSELQDYTYVNYVLAGIIVIIGLTVMILVGRRKSKSRQNSYQSQNQKHEKEQESHEYDYSNKREKEQGRQEKQTPAERSTSSLEECYRILEVNENSTSEDIQKSYKRLSLQWHPDKHTDPIRKKIAEEQMKLINKAKDIIKNAGKM